MKRRKAVLALLVGVVLLLLLAAGPAIAGKGSAVEEHAYLCYVDYSEAEIWWAGSTVHGRNISERTVLTGGSYEGMLRRQHNIVNWDLNLKTGQGTGWGTWAQEIKADDQWHHSAEGTWQSTLRLTEYLFPWQESIWLPTGHAVGHGVGEFAGLKIWATFDYEVQDPTIAFPLEGDHPCYAVYGFEPEPMSTVGTTIVYEMDHAAE